MPLNKDERDWLDAWVRKQIVKEQKYTTLVESAKARMARIKQLKIRLRNGEITKDQYMDMIENDPDPVLVENGGPGVLEIDD